MEREVGKERQEKEECKREIGRLNGIVSGNVGKLEGLERKCEKLERELKSFMQI